MDSEPRLLGTSQANEISQTYGLCHSPLRRRPRLPRAPTSPRSPRAPFVKPLKKKKRNKASRNTNVRKQAKKGSRDLLFKGSVRATRNVGGFFSSKQQPPEGRKCRGCSRRPCPKSTLGFWTRRGRPKQPTAAGPRPSRPPRGSTPETPPVWRGPACQRVIPPKTIRSVCVCVW
jgi:hypothetical protein